MSLGDLLSISLLLWIRFPTFAWTETKETIGYITIFAMNYFSDQILEFVFRLFIYLGF